MSLVQFGNNSAPYLNAENLNNNFEYLANLNNYSSDEIVVGKWINNKPLYRKVFDCGALPNSGVKSITTGLTDVYIVNIYGFARADSEVIMPLPFTTSTLENQVSVSIQTGNVIRLTSGIDRSNYTSSFITLEYTKTTD